MRQRIERMVVLLCMIGSTAWGQNAWQAGPAGPLGYPGACRQCGSTTCNGLACCPQPHFGFAPRPGMVQKPGGSGGFGLGNIRIGRAHLPDQGFPSGAVERPRERPWFSSGAGRGRELDPLRHTGCLAPGYLRAATLGWISPNGCSGCQPDGYPPGHSYYPCPWDQQQYPAYDGSGYGSYGDTCCGPYWYDFLVEGVAITRYGQDDVALASDGIRGLAPPNVVLSSGSADYDYELAYRFTGRFQLDAVNNIEATYLGGLEWDDTAVVTSGNNSLFSVYSDFGDTPFGGFEETDQASEMSANVFGSLESLELSYRRSWVSPDYRVNGSWFGGVRWVRFEDGLTYATVVSPHFDPINMVNRNAAFSQYSVLTKNDLVGPQIGTSIVACLIPGIALAGEAKAALYGNGLSQDSSIATSSLVNPVLESASDTQLAYGTDGRAYVIWQFHPLAKLRVGYEVMWLTGIATAADNFNANPAGVFTPVDGMDVDGIRTVDVNHDDDSIFHGGHIGFELGW